MSPTKLIKVREDTFIFYNHRTQAIYVLHFLDLIQQLKLPEDSMFSGFTPIIGYELKPVFIKTNSDRVCFCL